MSWIGQFEALTKKYVPVNGRRLWPKSLRPLCLQHAERNGGQEG